MSMSARIERLEKLKRDLEALGCTVTITSGDGEDLLTVRIVYPSDVAPPQLSADDGDRSLSAFTSMIRRGDFLILDTETTGLERGEIVQIAIVDAAGTVQLNTLVKPVNRIPLDASKIHDIYDSDVISAPDWATVSKMVQAILNGRDVVIYNATYDRKMMHQSAEAAGLAKVEWKELARFWDAMEPFAAIFGEWNDYRQNFKWQKLSTAASYYHLQVVDAHSALGDCLMTLGVVKAMAAQSTGGGDEGIPW